MTISLHRQEYLKKRRNKRLISYGIGCAIVLGLVILSSYVAHRSSLRISQVRLSGGVLISEQDISQEVFSYLSGSYLWLFPKNNALLYPRRDLERHLAETFHRIETIEVDLNGFRELNIRVIERKPAALWCNTNENCFFMDNQGTIFAEAPSFSGDAYFKYYGLVTSENPIGSVYLASTTQFAELMTLLTRAKEFSIHPLYLIGKDRGLSDGSREFTLILHGGGEVYFDTKDSITKTSDSLAALLRTPALKVEKNQDLPVQYIDLRYGNKLFYKLRTQ